MTRDIPAIGSEITLSRIFENGRSQTFGALRVLQSGWYAFIPSDGGPPYFSEGLPLFLSDLRPQGFLGRAIPQQHLDLNLPESISDWSDDHALTFLSKRGEDVQGNVIVGTESHLRWFQARGTSPHNLVDAADREHRYPLYAAMANAGQMIGSSAGGEQPKFTAAVAEESGSTNFRHVIVKFSPGIDSANGRRWADLLVCEHLAGETLRAHGVPAAVSTIHRYESRYFLEMDRFDRVGAQGRSPMVSFTGIDGLIGMMDKPWHVVARTLRDKAWISSDDYDRIRLASLFGALIGNNDMHPGNMSLAWDDNFHFSLLPIYDMLPMMYRPNSQGEVVGRMFDVNQLARADTSLLEAALPMADDFWARVIADARISDDFHDLAQRHVAQYDILREADASVDVDASARPSI